MQTIIDVDKMKRYFQSQTQQTIEKLTTLFSYPFHSDTDLIHFEIHYGPTANTYSIQVSPMEKMSASEVFENANGELIGKDLLRRLLFVVKKILKLIAERDGGKPKSFFMSGLKNVGRKPVVRSFICLVILVFMIHPIIIIYRKKLG